MTGVWERNVTGQGVTVVVVDDGVEHTIQDIAPNYVSGPGTTPPYLLLDIPSGLSFFLEVTMPNRRAWRWDGIHLLFPSRHSRLAIKTWGVAPASARRGSIHTSQDSRGQRLSEDQAVEEEHEAQGSKGKRSNLAPCLSFGETDERRWGAAALCGRLLLWKSCAEKKSTKCCCEKRKPILKH